MTNRSDNYLSTMLQIDEMRRQVINAAEELSIVTSQVRHDEADESAHSNPIML